MKAFLVLAAILLPTMASPCSKTYQLPPLDELEQGYDQSDAVFVATVLDQTPIEGALSGGFQMSLVVEHVWKSDGLPLTTALSGRGGGDCTIGPMNVGARYIVFAKRQSGSNRVLSLGPVEPVQMPPFPAFAEPQWVPEFLDKRYKLALAVVEQRSK